MTMHRYAILATAVLATMLSRGYFFSISRMFVPMMETFRSSRAEASTIMSVNVAVYMCSGVVFGLFVQRFGARVSGVVGVIFTCASIVTSYFATSIVHLTVGQGIFTGASHSLIQLSSVSVANAAFSGKSKYVALALIGLGPGVGGMLYTYLIEYLLSSYGLRGTLLITGGIALNEMALLLMWPKRRQLTAKVGRGDLKHCSTDNVTESHTATETIKLILSSKSFCFISMGFALSYVAQTTVNIFITDVLQERQMQGYLSSLTVLLITLFIAFGRLSVGLLKCVPHCSILAILLMATMFGIAASVLIAVGEDVSVLLVGCCLNGVAVGVFGSSSLAIAAVKLVGHENMVAGTGFAMTITGLFALIFGPVNGYIKDVTGSLVPVYYTIAGTTAVGGLMFCMAMLARLRSTS